MTAGLTDSQLRKSAAHSSCTRASSQLGADLVGDRPPVRGDARLSLVEPVPVGGVGGPEPLVRAVGVTHPGQALDHRPVGGRLGQRDDLAVVEDHGPAGQRERLADHPQTVPCAPVGAAARPPLPVPPHPARSREIAGPAPRGQPFEYKGQW